MNHSIFKTIVCSCGAWLWAAVCPALPPAAVCTLMVFADFVTARRLARRLRRVAADRAESLKFSSARFGRVISTLGRIYAVLVLASMVDSVLCPVSQPVLRYVCGAICLWQAFSMLENEASCNGSRWARIMRKVLVDKTERHLGISLDELRRSGDD